jgi:hypothetical protein
MYSAVCIIQPYRKVELCCLQENGVEPEIIILSEMSEPRKTNTEFSLS